jgi:hypothetical protein
MMAVWCAAFFRCDIATNRTEIETSGEDSNEHIDWQGDRGARNGLELDRRRSDILHRVDVIY